MRKKRFLMGRALAAGLLPLISALATGADFDLCGCEGHPESLGAFDSDDSSTWPPGTTISGSRLDSNAAITFTLPDDGVMMFDSMRLRRHPNHAYQTYFRFRRNADNTPVTLLVAGDLIIEDYAYLDIRGGDGSNGTSTIAGTGGSPGNGGFRGGDGASVTLNQSTDGGEGIGPGGGAAGTGSPLTAGGAGAYAGRLDLLPLIGGAGGGGGGSASCQAGGGGGGGGAILFAVNGTLNIWSRAKILADGGTPGIPQSTNCAQPGGRGSGGAVRIVARSVTGTGQVLARGGRVQGSSNDGIIRIEAISNSLTSSISQVDPPAIRTSLIGPLVNPLASWVGITAVDGAPVPEVLSGSTGGIDVMVPAPGLITFHVETAGVPGGTEVAMAVKPRVGGAAYRGTGLLDPGSCTSAGECLTFVTFDLPSGAYSAEAEATFLAP